MKLTNALLIFFTLFTFSCNTHTGTTELVLNDLEYFEAPGLNVMVFDDFYPEGHQGGVSVIQNGVRVAANGDVRLEPSPGQWSPIPKVRERTVDSVNQQISARLSYPDSSLHLQGFNPLIYPDLIFDYAITVTPEGKSFRIRVDLDEPLPEEWIGKVGFHLELFPGILFGKSYYMDDQSGIFPQQANGPMIKDADGEWQVEPLAEGSRLTIAPDTEAQTMAIQSEEGGPLQLIDGRGKHNNSWFIVRSAIPGGATENAISWLVSPNVLEDWKSEPVAIVSQVGYHPAQEKIAIFELDKNDRRIQNAALIRLGKDGAHEKVIEQRPEEWGRFLRYKYLTFDFSSVEQPGLYKIKFGDQETHAFKIGEDVYERHVWQPTIEYFLPVQMCHMRVNERYRVWHGLCHLDDALMAPVDTNHFDGYKQGPSTLTQYQPLEPVPGLNVGGWHDAGDYDLRVESQAGTVYKLSLIYEQFNVDYDQTTIDQENRLVEIHQPDGKPDVLQQVEHGVLSILAGYRNLGRLYRGIIAPTIRQYVLLGDGSTMTDNRVYDESLAENEIRNDRSGVLDDRLVFTEENPARALDVAGGLAAAYRALSVYNAELADECLQTAEALWRDNPEGNLRARTKAAVELLLATQKDEYRNFLTDSVAALKANIKDVGWILGRAMPLIHDENFQNQIIEGITELKSEIDAQEEETPFGVPYRPHIWGAGWGIQDFGVQQYFLYKGFPDIFTPDYMVNAMNFILGVHPGSNSASFASGVGANSLTVAYGVNRADWSYIPGGVGSGTALIRPDFPELKEWPFFWQQTEYVIGGGGTNFMFLVLAARDLFADQ